MDSTAECVLRLHNVAKAFSGIQALGGVSFDLQPGEVHALVGENGAGKSTLIKIVAGAYLPDSGGIEIDGTTHEGLSPDEAARLGVRVVYQDFNLVPELSVAENIFLGAQPTSRFGLLDTAARRRGTVALLERLGTHVDPDRLVKHLTVGEQQIVEIAKALATDARILIMDEPSAVLPSHDMERLYGVIRALRAAGTSVIYISHRLDEIFQIADRVTGLKDGRSVMTTPVAETTRATLVNSMVGRQLTEQYPPRDACFGETLLEVRDLCVDGCVHHVSFTVRGGEIVGLAGLGGSGRTTVARALVGLAKIDSGQILVDGEAAPRNPAQAARLGIALIPEDRKAHGLVLSHSVRFNVTLPNLARLLRWGWLIVRRGEKALVDGSVRRLQIRPPAIETAVENLSGGNQQKVVLAKWLVSQPRLIVLDEPTRGVDVGAKAEIYVRMRELTREGVGIIMISSELPELLGMSDRILVFHEGRIAGELAGPAATEAAVMHLATGSPVAEEVEGYG
ncbi:MAG TPA: sugar ABC transporter ATP-binding protein [Chloroflexota bacterium]|nr:sugar ABC transporter ATP-binding protein [Chloroflexota bacterium]